MDIAPAASESSPVILNGLHAQTSGGNIATINVERKDGEVFVDKVKVVKMACDGTQLTLTTGEEEYYIYNGHTIFGMTVNMIHAYLKGKSDQP